MEQSVKKRKKYWIWKILGVLLLLILTAAVLLATWLVPKARRLQRALISHNCAISAQLRLNFRALSADQQKFLRNLCLLTGLDEADWERLKLQGGYDTETVELSVYDGQDELLTRLYLTQDCQAMDLHAIYDRAYDHLTERIGLLSHLLPQWSLGDYVALRQLQYAFGLELGKSEPGKPESGKLPDFEAGLERLQSKLSLPTLCGVILAADQWDREAQKLVYHITADDKRLALIQGIAEKTGHTGEAGFWQWPEGAALDVVIYLGEPKVRMQVTGKLPEVKQLADWSVELVWDDYVAGSGDISLVDQQMLNDLASLLRLLETLRGQ